VEDEVLSPEVSFYGSDSESLLGLGEDPDIMIFGVCLPFIHGNKVSRNTVDDFEFLRVKAPLKRVDKNKFKKLLTNIALVWHKIFRTPKSSAL